MSHRHIHTSTDHFGSFQLSPDGHQLLYIAEREKPKSESYFKKEAASTSGDQPPVEKVAILLCLGMLTFVNINNSRGQSSCMTLAGGSS